MFFGLAAIPMVIAAGSAIDTVRINRERASFIAALDSAAFAIASDDRSAIGTGGTVSQTNIDALKAMAKAFLKTNYSPSNGKLAGEATLDITVTGAKVNVKATLEFPTTIMKLVGVNSLWMTAESQVEKAMRPVEIVLVIDTTGSMGRGKNFTSSSTKMTQAQQAAHDLLAKVYSGTRAAMPRSEYLRVALVPFAAGVRLNQTAYDFNLNWIDTNGLNPLSRLHFNGAATWNNFMAWSQMKTSATTQLAWNGCVEARARGSAALGTDFNVNDIAPSTSSPSSLFPAYFAPDAPSVANFTQYSSTYRGYNFNNTYIAEAGAATTTATTGETAGMAYVATSPPVTAKNNMTTAGFLYRQGNAAKYVNAVITPQANGIAGPWSGCAASTIVPMTYNRESVEVGIDAMDGSGNTLIAEGLMWGLRVISPTAPFTLVEGSGSGGSGIPASTIAPFNGPRWQKVMLMMTDGDNDLAAGTVDTKDSVTKAVNGMVYSSYGRGLEAVATSNRFPTTNLTTKMAELDTELIAACTKVKSDKGTSDVTDDNVLLYVTSFGTGVSSTTQTRLQQCATAPSYYQHSTTGADLSAFFDHVGQDVLNKMIFASK
jgi:Flp pilus assembly protein TadG